MRSLLQASIIVLLTVQSSFAGSLVKKLDIPDGYYRGASYDYSERLDYNQDGFAELILRSDDLRTYKALDPGNGYAEVWSFTGNPSDYAAPGYTYFYFRFMGFHRVVAGATHAIIEYEYYDAAVVQRFGILVFDVAGNTLSWRLDDYHYSGFLEHVAGGDVLEDFVFYNRATERDEIWGYDDAPSAVNGEGLVRPVELGQNVPNPFNPTTVVSFTLREKADTRLEIHDVRGRLVRSITLGVRDSGDHHWTWRGEDNAGRSVASGTYYYTIYAGAERQSRKMTLLR
jgi:hypothetical protein